MFQVTGFVLPQASPKGQESGAGVGGADIFALPKKAFKRWALGASRQFCLIAWLQWRHASCSPLDVPPHLLLAPDHGGPQRMLLQTGPGSPSFHSCGLCPLEASLQCIGCPYTLRHTKIHSQIHRQINSTCTYTNTLNTPYRTLAPQTQIIATHTFPSTQNTPQTYTDTYTKEVTLTHTSQNPNQI